MSGCPDKRPHFDTGYGSTACIRSTELVIVPCYDAPKRYPLASITGIRESGLPGGQSVVVITMRGEGEGPGLTFADPDTATGFTDALLAATR